MTREEAIIILDCERPYGNCGCGASIEEIEDALNMAIKALEQEPCEDCISRQVVKEQMIKYGFHAPDMTVTEFVESLPPVTPQQKTGQWWERNTYPQECRSWDCSECQEIVFEKTNYCPNCGAKMEVEE